MTECSIVDVVMPVHNGERTIAAAITSVCAQTERRWHLFVVDDGSTDGTKRVVDGFDDERITLIGSDRRGVCAARNRGLAAGRSASVAFLDCDDEVSAGWLSMLQPTPAMPLVRARASFVDGDGSVRASPARETPLLAGNFVVRRELLAAVGGYDERLAYSENTDLEFRLDDVIRSQGLTVGYVEVPVVTVARDADRASRYPPQILRDAAELLLDKHGRRFAEAPHLEAAYRAVAGYNSLVLGETQRARGHLQRAVRLAPANPRYLARLVQTYLPAGIRALDPTIRRV